MEVIVSGLIAIWALALIYLFYQIIRNQKVFEIKMKWLSNSDPRSTKYSYDYMFDPNRKNWWGLKFPNEKDYQ